MYWTIDGARHQVVPNNKRDYKCTHQISLSNSCRDILLKTTNVNLMVNPCNSSRDTVWTEVVDTAILRSREQLVWQK